MDTKDEMFLAHLRRNSRATLTEISKHTDIPISTLYDRLHVLQAEVIKKHTSIIDFTQLGYGCRASIVLKVRKEIREKMKEYLRKHQCVNSLLKINNGYDFMVEGVFVNVKALEEMLDELEQRFEILEKHVYYVIEDISRENFLADPALANISGKPGRRQREKTGKEGE